MMIKSWLNSITDSVITCSCQIIQWNPYKDRPAIKENDSICFLYVIDHGDPGSCRKRGWINGNILQGEPEVKKDAFFSVF